MVAEIKITEETIREIIKEKLPEWFSEELASSKGNLEDVVEELIKEQDGVVRKLVKGVLNNVLSDKEFRHELSREFVVMAIYLQQKRQREAG